MKMAEAFLRVTNLEKRFGTQTAVAGISFDATQGEFLTLLGPSGCGKSTTLRCIAGLERPDEGTITIGEDLVTDVARGVLASPERRDVGMVFQFYALWPHLTVYKNVAFPLRMRGRSSRDIRVAVERALELVGLSGLEDRLPGSLSGGQQQRVALARALSYSPRLLLLDEPLSNLDARLRERMRVEISQLQRRLGITTVYVTHDQVEAMVMSDRVAVMHGGRIHQLDTPRRVYEDPADVFVAGFVGVTNLLEGRMLERRADGSARVALLSSKPDQIECLLHGEAAAGDPVALVVRPEHMEIADDATLDQPNVLTGEVTGVLYLGDEMDVRVSVLGREIRVKADPRSRLRPGETIRLRLDPDRCIAMPMPAAAQSSVATS